MRFSIGGAGVDRWLEYWYWCIVSIIAHHLLISVLVLMVVKGIGTGALLVKMMVEVVGLSMDADGLRVTTIVVRALDLLAY